MTDQDIKALVNGYDRRKYPEIKGFRAMTIEEAKALNGWICSSEGCDNPTHNETRLKNPKARYVHVYPTSHVWILCNDGKARQAKVNGKVRTWKRNPDRVEVPLKYGLYEYATFTTADIEAGRLLMPVEMEDVK